MVDPIAHRAASHPPSIERLQVFGRCNHILHSRIEPQIVSVWIKDDWHSVVNDRGYRIWCCRQDRASLHSLPVSVPPAIPQSCDALLAADALGLVVSDASNPRAIKQLSQTLLPPFNPFPAANSIGSVTLAASVAVQNGLVYVGTTTNDEDATAAVAAFDFTGPTSPRLVGFRTQIGDDISVVSPSGNQLFLAANGLVIEYDNTLPRNSIELYNPPAALAQSLAAPSMRPSRKSLTRTSPGK